MGKCYYIIFYVFNTREADCYENMSTLKAFYKLNMTSDKVTHVMWEYRVIERDNFCLAGL